MPGFVVHQGAMVQCEHAGPAQPMMVDLRVKVSGKPIVVQTNVYQISCPLPPIAPPCVTGTWTKAAERVFASGIPVVLADSKSVCVPTGVRLVVLSTQARVTGT